MRLKTPLIAAGFAVVSEAILMLLFAQCGYANWGCVNGIAFVYLTFHLPAFLISSSFQLGKQVGTAVFVVSGAFQFFLLFLIVATIWGRLKK